MEPVNFKPRNSLVLIRRLKPTRENKVHGIYVPDGLEDFQRAIIVAKGPGFANNAGTRDVDTEDLENGMTVLIKAQKTVHGPQGQQGTQRHTQKLMVGGTEYELMDQRDILGIVPNPEADQQFVEETKKESVIKLST